MKTFKQALHIRRRGFAFDVVAFILMFALWIGSGGTNRVYALGAAVAGFLLFAKTLTIWLHRARIIEDFSLRGQANSKDEKG